MKTSLTLLVILFTAASMLPQEDSTTEYEMKTYYMVFLKKGPNRTQDSASVAEIQAGHLANIERLAKEGKIDIAGPFLVDDDLRGIFIFNLPTEEEVKQNLETDPAIKSGRLTYEIRPWYAAKGSCLR